MPNLIYKEHLNKYKIIICFDDIDNLSPSQALLRYEK